MAKFAPDVTIDALLDRIAGANKMIACNAAVTTFTAANVTNNIGEVAMAGGDFTKADAGGGGRQITIASKTGVTASATASATHIALVNTGDSSLRYVTTCPSTGLTDTQSFDIAAWIVTVGDPT